MTQKAKKVLWRQEINANLNGSVKNFGLLLKNGGFYVIMS